MQDSDFKKTIEGWENIDPDYKDIVIEAFRKEESFDIENSDLDHAKFLSFLLIHKAKKNIRIFTGRLKELFYNDANIREAFKNALDNNVKIDIIVENEPQCKEFVTFIKDNRGISLYKYNKKFNINNHFLLVDNNAFRIEAPHTDKQLNEKIVKGFANFNSPKRAKRVLNVFDNVILTNSKSI